MIERLTIPQDIEEAFDRKDYNNKRNLLFQARDKKEGRKVYPCPYEKSELCRVCDYLQGLEPEEIERAIKRIDAAQIKKNVQLKDLLEGE